MYAWTLRGYFPCDSPPKSVNKGARFWGFLRFRESGVLGGNHSIPLDSLSFGGQNRSYGCPRGTPSIPKVLCESVERIGRSGFGFWGVDPQVVHPERPGPDRWPPPVWPVQPPVGFWLGWTCCCVPLSLGLLQFQVWCCLVLGRLVSWIWGFLAWTSLTGVLYRPNRCKSLFVEIVKSCSCNPARGPGWPVVSLESVGWSSDLVRVIW
jgi:hypothetical protein